MLLISIYVIFAALIAMLLPLSPSTQIVLWSIDTVICAVFFVGFVVQFVRAPQKWVYMKHWGWVDLLSSIPGIPGIPWTRFMRFFRIARAIRIIHSYRHVRPRRLLLTWWRRRRAESALVGAFIAAIFLLILSSLLILQIETAPTSNIETPGDALWWGLVTVSTVGYGDKYPVTEMGRLMASLLILAGVVLFTTLAGFLANMFVQPESADQGAEIEDIQADVTEIKRLLQELLDQKEGGDQ